MNVDSIPSGGRAVSVRRLIFALFLLGLLALEVRGQGLAVPEGPGRAVADTVGEDTTASAVPLTAPLKIRQAPLDAVVVVSADGSQQIHLPGWPLEELDKISALLRNERQAPNPPFILQEIAATGKVVENRVEAEVRLVLTSTENRSVLVPIGLKEGVLPYPDTVDPDAAPASEPYRYRGPGSMNLTMDPQTGQYLVLLHPPRREPAPGDVPAEESSETTEKGVEKAVEKAVEKDTPPPTDLRHEITLTLWFPLTRIGSDENRLAISFPQALGSQFVLTVPIPDAVATVAQGSLLDLPETEDDRSTRFRMLGLKPDFQMTWRRKKAETVDEQPVLSVEEAQINARMEPKSTVYDVLLPVRSRNGEFERVQIRLPQGTSLDHESTERYASLGGYTFGLLAKEERQALTPPANDPPTGLASPAPSQILEIRLPRKTAGPVNVRFKAVQQDDAITGTGGWRNLGGFEVLDAARQTGQLGVVIPPNMRPNWNPIRGIRRSEAGSGTALDGVDARFDFFSQSFLLRCKFVSPHTKVNVQPEYQVRINKGALDLTARFSYVVYGSKTERLSIDLSGWQWNNEIGPSTIVDNVGVEQDENGLLTIPLRAPMDGQFDIELKAFRPLTFPDEGRHRLVVPLPQPKADWIKQAAVAVVPADNVEVVPVDENFETTPSVAPEPENFSGSGALSTRRISNLSRRGRRSLPLTIDIPDRQQEPLFYETEPGGSVFVADIQYHQQKVAATLLTEIRLGSPGEHVTQFISYDVSYVPIERLYFLVPKSLTETSLAVRIGGKPLELRDVTPGPGEIVPENWSKKMLQLPEAMFRFQVIFDYAIPPVTIEHDLTTPFSLSFIRPIETRLGDHRVHMTVPTGFRIELDEESRAQWTSSEAETSFTGTEFRSPQAPNRISLWISTGERDALGTTVVERAWLQTWLYGTVREDRGIYDVTCDRLKSITLWLPPDAVKGRVFVRRDQVPILPELSPSGELTIPLSENRSGTVRIEVVYRITPFDIPNRSIDLTLPHFGPALVRNEYWQIILPQNRHIIGIPTGWAPEYEWAWTNGFFWGRVPSLSRADAGFEEDPSDGVIVPSESNQYLFSSLHPPVSVTIRILDRSLIVLLSSGLALLIGLTLIYFPKTRYAGSLLALAVALLAMMLYRPAPVLLMLQAASLGVFLALGAAYVYRILNRDEKWVVPKARPWEEASREQEVYSVIMDEESGRRQSAESDEEQPTGNEPGTASPETH